MSSKFEPEYHYKFDLIGFELVSKYSHTKDEYVYKVLTFINNTIEDAIRLSNFNEEATKLITDALDIDTNSSSYLKSIKFAKDNISMRINRILHRGSFDEVTRAKFKLLGYPTT